MTHIYAVVCAQRVTQQRLETRVSDSSSEEYAQSSVTSDSPVLIDSSDEVIPSPFILAINNTFKKPNIMSHLQFKVNHCYSIVV